MERKFAAVLLHFYSQPLLERPAGSTDPQDRKLDIRNHLVISAAVHLYKEGKVSNFFIAGARIHGENELSMAELMAQKLAKRGVDPSNIWINSQAVETAQELNLFLQEAGKNNWDSLGSIANRVHNRRIWLIHRKRQINNVNRLTAEDILKPLNRRYELFLRKFRLSCREFIFSARELLVFSAYLLLSENMVARLSKNPVLQALKSKLDK